MAGLCEHGNVKINSRNKGLLKSYLNFSDNWREANTPLILSQAQQISGFTKLSSWGSRWGLGDIHDSSKENSVKIVLKLTRGLRL